MKDIETGNLNRLGVVTQKPIRLLVWGDSHAMAILPILDVLCTDYSVNGIAITYAGRIPLVDYYTDSKEAPFNNAVIDYIRKEHINNVLLAAFWDSYKEPQLRHALISTLNKLRQCGSNVWVMRDVPKQPWNVPRALANIKWHGGDTKTFGLPLVKYQLAMRYESGIFEGLAAPDVKFLDPSEVLVCPNGLCCAEDGGSSLYWDDDHLTIRGAELLRPIFECIFDGMRMQNNFNTNQARTSHTYHTGIGRP